MNIVEIVRRNWLLAIVIAVLVGVGVLAFSVQAAHAGEACDPYYGESGAEGRLTHNVQVRLGEVVVINGVQMYVRHVAQLWVAPNEEIPEPRWLYQRHMGNHPERLTQVRSDRGLLIGGAANVLCNALTEVNFNFVAEAFEHANPLRDHGPEYIQIVFNRTSAVTADEYSSLAYAATEIWRVLRMSGLAPLHE